MGEGLRRARAAARATRFERCRCALMVPDGSKVDVRCGRSATSAKDGLCDECRRHRKKDEKNPCAPYHGRYRKTEGEPL